MPACALLRWMPAPQAVVVECVSLGDEGRSQLEVRAQAQLASSVEGRQLVVRCRGSEASLEVRDGSGDDRSSSVAITGVGTSAPDDVDAILAGLRRLLLEPPAPSVPSIGAPPIPEAEPPESDHAPQPSARRRSWSLLAGADGELWQGAVTGAIGGHAGGSLDLGGPWAITAIVGPAIGIGNASGTSVWTVQAVAQVDWVPTPWLRVSLGSSGRVLWAQASSLSPSQQSGVTGGGVASVRFALPIDDVELSLGPTLDVMLRPVAVDVEGRELFRLPSVVAALTLEARYPTS